MIFLAIAVNYSLSSDLKQKLAKKTKRLKTYIKIYTQKTCKH